LSMIVSFERLVFFGLALRTDDESSDITRIQETVVLLTFAVVQERGRVRSAVAS